ncbi:hypothetical protein AYO38_10525 [bacterium SCGC AG-212-C10]|nr:hypothetical protein AYO38_10525 [bacterium SCGC AG-212-C10]
MAVPVRVPRFGIGREWPIIAEWYHGDGDQVVRGDAVFRVESQNIAFDVEAEEAGTLRHLALAGLPVEAGDPAAYVLAAGEELPEDAEDIAALEWANAPDPASLAGPRPFVTTLRWPTERERDPNDAFANADGADEEEDAAIPERTPFVSKLRWLDQDDDDDDSAGTDGTAGPVTSRVILRLVDPEAPQPGAAPSTPAPVSEPLGIPEPASEWTVESDDDDEDRRDRDSAEESWSTPAPAPAPAPFRFRSGRAAPPPGATNDGAADAPLDLTPSLSFGFGASESPDWENIAPAMAPKELTLPASFRDDSDEERPQRPADGPALGFRFRSRSAPARSENEDPWWSPPASDWGAPSSDNTRTNRDAPRLLLARDDFPEPPSVSEPDTVEDRVESLDVFEPEPEPEDVETSFLVVESEPPAVDANGLPLDAPAWDWDTLASADAVVTDDEPGDVPAEAEASFDMSWLADEAPQSSNDALAGVSETTVAIETVDDDADAWAPLSSDDDDDDLPVIVPRSADAAAAQKADIAADLEDEERWALASPMPMADGATALQSAGAGPFERLFGFTPASSTVEPVAAQKLPDDEEVAPVVALAAEPATDAEDAPAPFHSPNALGSSWLARFATPHTASPAAMVETPAEDSVPATEPADGAEEPLSDEEAFAGIMEAFAFDDLPADAAPDFGDSDADAATGVADDEIAVPVLASTDAEVDDEVSESTLADKPDAPIAADVESVSIGAPELLDAESAAFTLRNSGARADLDFAAVEEPGADRDSWDFTESKYPDDWMGGRRQPEWSASSTWRDEQPAQGMSMLASSPEVSRSAQPAQAYGYMDEETDDAQMFTRSVPKASPPAAPAASYEVEPPVAASDWLDPNAVVVRQVLVLRADIRIGAAEKLALQTASETQPGSQSASTATLFAGAVSGALADAPFEAPPVHVYDTGAVVPDPDAVLPFQIMPPGIREAVPRLTGLQAMAFAAGAAHIAVTGEVSAPTFEPVVTLTLAYDGDVIDDGEAARVLTRVRELMETPASIAA